MILAMSKEPRPDPRQPVGETTATAPGTHETEQRRSVAADRTSTIRRRVGHFRLEEKLGEGGVGAVYLAFDERLERRVALKALRPEVAGDVATREQFLREARLLSQLHHPNICQVHDLVRDGEDTWLVLEYIEGRTLAEAMDGVGRESKLDIAIGVAEAIAAAHREGVVHRDMKPENIMLHVEGGVKVLDFGLAHSLNDARPGLRWSGTLLYMSPEQANRGEVGAASDLYSFGLVLQELLTGQPAYPVLPFDEVLERVRRGETVPVDGLDPDAKQLIQRLQAFESGDRPDARETVRALRFLRDKPARRRRRRWALAVAAALSIVVLGALLGTWQARRQVAERAELARQFTREADDIEWLLRSAYLGPPRDLRPMQRQVRERMDALRRRMEEVGDVGRGPGEYALGRAAVALGDYRRAWQHLDTAWQRGYRPPEVGIALGLASLEIYRLEGRLLESMHDSARIEKLRNELEARWLAPALKHLERGRESLRQRAASGAPVRSKAESADYVAAVAALDSGDLDGALQHAQAALDREPWLYEAEMLRGEVHRRRAWDLQRERDLEPAGSAYELARQAFGRAAQQGRSDPAVYLEACATELADVTFRIYFDNAEVETPLQAGEDFCQLARQLDEDKPQAWRLLSELRMRRGEVSKEPEEALRSAAEMARAAIQRDPQNADAWRSLGHVYSVQSDARLARYRDADVPIARMIAAYTESFRLAPQAASASNALGNAYGMRARALFDRGLDGRADADRALAAYYRAIDLAPDSGYETNLALTYWSRAEFELRRGLDASSSIDRGLEAQKRGLEGHPGYSTGLVNLADLELLAGLQAARQGRRDSAALERAVATCRKALAAEPEGWVVLFRCLPVVVTILEKEMICTGAKPELFDLAERLLDIDPHAASVIELLQAIIHRLKATELLIAESDPKIELRRAEAAILRVLEMDSNLVEARLEQGRLTLVDAVWRLHNGLDAGAELASAEAAFDTVAGRRPQRFEADVGRIQLALVRGTLGGDPMALDQAEALLADLRDRAPGVTEFRRLERRQLVDLVLAPRPCA